MGILDEEREYLWEDALIQAEKEHKDWHDWQEYQRSLQKPAKIEVLIKNGEKIKGELQKM